MNDICKCGNKYEIVHTPMNTFKLCRNCKNQINEFKNNTNLFKQFLVCKTCKKPLEKDFEEGKSVYVCKNLQCNKKSILRQNATKLDFIN